MPSQKYAGRLQNQSCYIPYAYPYKMKGGKSSLSKVEVFLNESQVNSLKSILTQSEHGVHVLFENSLITEVFKQDYSEDDFFQVENLKLVQDHMLKLLQFKSLTDKQDFIRCLDKDAQHRIVRAYFYMIEHNLRQTQKLPH